MSVNNKVIDKKQTTYFYANKVTMQAFSNGHDLYLPYKNIVNVIHSMRKMKI